MDSLTNTQILDFNSDTLQYVRKQHNLDHPERMKEAIDIIQEWIRKQNHFAVKCFPRDYLERLIINNKGLLEKSKRKIDRLCTLKTLSPDYFEIFDFNECDFNMIKYVFLPILTPKHFRVAILKYSGNNFNSKIVYNYFRHSIWMSDYQQARDYCDGTVYIVDFIDANVVDYIRNINLMEFKKFLEIFLEGYSTRIKEIHLLTESKSVQIILTLLKQVLSEKLNKRIVIHKKIDTVYDYIPKYILPSEYGGTEKPMEHLHNKMIKELTSTDFMECKKEMNEWVTNEEHRQADKFNEEYIGMSGTFRRLQVD